jgi:hypothetical protein
MLACVGLLRTLDIAHSFQVMCVPYEETVDGFEMQIGVSTAISSDFVGAIR